MSAASREKRRKRIAQENRNLDSRIRLQSMCIRKFGDICGLYKSKRGKEYFAWLMDVPGSVPGTYDYYVKRIVDIHNLRLDVIQQLTIQATEAAETGKISYEELEIVLDYLFAEMNSRLNKPDKKVKSNASPAPQPVVSLGDCTSDYGNSGSCDRLA